MAGPANPNAMAPPTPGPTRTAPPQMPSSWWSAPRIRTYLLFDATGIVYMLAGFVAIRLVWALSKGPEAYEAVRAGYSNPLYIAFHALTLVSLVFVAVRFFRLFPKAQPPAIGPLKPPPAGVIHAGLYVAYIGVTLVISAILAGVIF